MKKDKEIELLKFVTKKNIYNELVIPISQKKRYFLRILKNKTLIVSLTIFLIVFIFLILSYIFYNEEPNKPINNALFLNKELPSEITPFKNEQILPGPKLELFKKLANQYNDSVFINKIIGSNLYNVSYNAYKIIDDKNLVHILGTNSYGIDIFSRIIHSQLNILLIALISITFALILSTFSALIIALYIRKRLSKFINNLFTTFTIVPYLILSVILFLIFKNSFINAILIFTIISSLILFCNAYNKTLSVLNEEYVMADIAIGFSKYNLLWKTLLMPVINSQLIQIIEHFSLILVSYSAISIFSIDNSNNLTFGLIIKEGIQLFDKNPYYLITTSIITTSLTFSFKFISVELNKIYEPKRGIYE
ncbi:ABC transporter permease subunit [Mycoplasma elephantis]|uniref:ABC transporter permease subunit n=1 Tax=Mycoplasma elephantis TaxID=114882 RepID=UPI000486B993|nr:ABC transporter permease subunit [Mycoplasma elephantis]